MWTLHIWASEVKIKGSEGLHRELQDGVRAGKKLRTSEGSVHELSEEMPSTCWENVYRALKKR